MNRSRIIALFTTIALLCLPVFAAADDVHWKARNFSTFAQTLENEYTTGQNQIYYIDDYHFEKKPTTAQVKYDNGAGGYGIATTEANKTFLRVYATSLDITQAKEINAYAGAAFYGTFIGTGSDLNLRYSLSTPGVLQYTIYDKTTDSLLYDGGLVSGSGHVKTPIPRGHEIDININLEVSVDSAHGIGEEVGCYGKEGVQLKTGSLHYTFSVNKDDD